MCSLGRKGRLINLRRYRNLSFLTIYAAERPMLAIFFVHSLSPSEHTAFQRCGRSSILMGVLRYKININSV